MSGTDCPGAWAGNDCAQSFPSDPCELRLLWRYGYLRYRLRGSLLGSIQKHFQLGRRCYLFLPSLLHLSSPHCLNNFHNRLNYLDFFYLLLCLYTYMLRPIGIRHIILVIPFVPSTVKLLHCLYKLYQLFPIVGLWFDFTPFADNSYLPI